MIKKKKCSKCGNIKYLTQFHKSSRREKFDGRSTVCKLCTRTREIELISKSETLKEKECHTCNEVKPASEFHKNSGKRGGLSEHCKSCRNTNIVEKRYNLSKGQLEQMKKQVDNKCQICNNELPLAVDHCHSTGKVRGLLCGNCNNGLGRFKDNISYLKNAIKYLEEA